MSVEIRVPRLAESISDAVLVEWLRPEGAAVRADEPVATLETDKAAMEIAAPEAGVLRHARAPGDRVVEGDVLARLEPAGPAEVPAVAPEVAPPVAPAPATTAAPAAGEGAGATPVLGPAARRLVEEHGLDPAAIAATGRGGRLLKEDVLRHLGAAPAEPAPGGAATGAPSGSPPVAPPPVMAEAPWATPARAAPTPAPPPSAASPPGSAPVAADAGAGASERVVPMSRIRQRIAERLVRAQHTAAILTTFNEVDVTAVMTLRARLKDAFEAKHGVRLGLMSFFARASVLALAEIPELNAEIRGTDIVYRDAVHLGIAVGTERGLVVPVVRHAERMDFAALEREIARLAGKGRAGTLTLEELSGGTFTISNGGVYGSLLSTPILNPPQSGILGMHKIQKRPVAVDDQVAIRPMMYVALSYDHRIVDGEQAVTFLVRVKERLEDPERMLLGV
uniref:Dihydrolipoyllysine-residue succinyltransferase component of 2-oxoglutarate dehydrogenase complex n=1 Tax=Eiseniibacteriota bacterium TaxID=2212470 RepID=A0A832I1V0_UNCEI